MFSEILIGNEIKTFEDLKSLIENRDEMALAFPNDEKMQECFHDIEQGQSAACHKDSVFLGVQFGAYHAEKIRKELAP